MSVLTLGLADPRAVLEVVGGKGMSLARLAAEGLPVPGGLHVTTEAYKRFIADSDLRPALAAALATADVSRPATLESASEEIRARFGAATMDEEIAGAIVQAYAGMAGDDPFVAVRSSATAEDVRELSFAGQQDTYLNVRGATEVLEAVQRCWASL